ncbi:MAG: hypothetical protein ACYSWP_07380 [Planctomycetota bacterium]|jgi:hypothetical protein
MGVEISTQSRLPSTGFLRKTVSKETLFKQIQKAIKDIIDDPILDKALRFDRDQHSLIVQLHPAGGVLEFTWQPAGYIDFYTKTSIAGPGYHAFALELLESIGERCSLEWQWNEPDSLGRPINRDFETIKQQMAGIIQTIARSVNLDSQGVASRRINMHMEFPETKGGTFAISPSGPWPKSWWEELAKATDTELFTKAGEFFPWWNKDQDAVFWRNYGMVLLWCDVPWHVPIDEHERQMYRLAIDCFERAKSMNPQIEVPDAEIKELEQLLDKDPQVYVEPPRSKGIGFRRHVMGFRTFRAWTIDIPGYYYCREQDEGQTILFWFADKTVRFSSLTIECNDGRAASTQELLDVQYGEKHLEVADIEFKKDHLLGRYCVDKTSQDGEGFWMLQGRVACGGGANTLAIITICFDQPQDREWAVSTLKTVSHPEPTKPS